MPTLRRWAILGMCLLLLAADRSTVQRLIAGLSDPSPKVRAGAAVALGQQGRAATSALPALMKTLRDPDAQVRQAAAYALSQMPDATASDAAAVRALTDALADRQATVRETAALGLTALGSALTAYPHSIQALTKTLADPQESVRQAAAGALARLGRPGALALIQGLGDPTWWGRDLAAHTLRSLGPSVIPLLADTLLDPQAPEPIRLAAIQVLGQIGPPAAPTLADALAGLPGPKTLRLALIQALGQLGPEVATDTKVTEALTATMQDSDPEIRLAASQALGDIQLTAEYDF